MPTVAPTAAPTAARTAAPDGCRTEHRRPDAAGGPGGTASRPALRRCVRRRPRRVRPRRLVARTAAVHDATQLAVPGTRRSTTCSPSPPSTSCCPGAACARRSSGWPRTASSRRRAATPGRRHRRDWSPTRSPTTGCSSCSLDGHTVVLQGLHRLWPPLIDFAGALTTDLGHPVQVNAYVTPALVAGLLGALRRARRLRAAGRRREALADPRAGARGAARGTSRGPTTAPPSRPRGRGAARHRRGAAARRRALPAARLPARRRGARRRDLPPDRRRAPGHPPARARGTAGPRGRRARRCGRRCRWASTSATRPAVEADVAGDRRRPRPTGCGRSRPPTSRPGSATRWSAATGRRRSRRWPRPRRLDGLGRRLGAGGPRAPAPPGHHRR